ncbi:MAG: hypothetical protein ACK4TC_14580 [Sphingomonas pseudosanguinis]|uniref:hypothetical protein n=1 Tax=Sphingomonas pseudosanguinis TaxID=413712 RepID=UPI00391CFA30
MAGKSELFQNLRSGAVIRSSGANENTVRAWLRNNHLRLSEDRNVPGVQPRYNLADAARLKLMHMLTTRFTLAAMVAAEVTNEAANHIDVLSSAELTRLDGLSTSSPQWIMVLGSGDGTLRPEIMTAEVVRERGFVAIEMFVDLRAIVRLSRDALLNQLPDPKPSLFDLPHDF